MRVVANLPLYPPGSRVGAWISTHECLAALVERGHDVHVITYLHTPPFPYDLDGVHVHSRAELGEVAAAADVIVSHLGDDQQASAYAHEAGIPSVRMVHGTPAANHRLVDGELAVFNSASLAGEVRWPGRQVVVHPPIHQADYQTTPGDLVTLVNLSVSKGAHVLWALARRMPDTQFLAVRGSYGTQVVRSRPNVEVIDPTPDMAADVYARTRTLLMPSKAETWGRTGIEAACSGIPTIAHPTPGLLESLADAGTFIDRSNIAAWAAAIRRLQDPDQWAAASHLARARAVELDPAPDLARFVEAIEDLPVRVAA